METKKDGALSVELNNDGPHDEWLKKRKMP